MGSGTFNVRSYMDYSNAVTRDCKGNVKPVEEIFLKRKIAEALDPAFIQMRESCDNEEHPESRPFILALDVTGSMGNIAKEIAVTGLGSIMSGILESDHIKDPQVMFMAIGDAAYDKAPLQVSQFESDLRIAKQLVDIYVEGGGGGNSTESYDLAWYFASQKTKIDSFEKRGVKGYLFTMGDEFPPQGINKSFEEKIFKDQSMMKRSQVEFLDATTLLQNAKEKYEVFHILIEQGDFMQRNAKIVYTKWQNLLGNRAILCKDYTKIPEIILAVIRVNEGETVENVIKSFPDCTDVIERALYGLNLQTGS